MAITALRQSALLTARNPHGMRAEAPNTSQIPSRKDVEATLRDAISRRPLDPQPWWLLGDLYAQWTLPDDALYAYGQAKRRGADSAVVDQDLAGLYAVLGDERQARTYWEKYLSRRPDDHSARLALAWTNVRLADWSTAIAQLERLLTDRGDDPVLHAWLGLLQIGPDPEKGGFHLQRAVEDPELAKLIAPVLAVQSHAAASDNPAYRSALLGIALLDLNVSAVLKTSATGLDAPGCSVAEAENAITTLALRSLLAATHRSPAYADAYAYLGQAFDRLGWPEWARASLNRALDLAPHSPVVQTLLGLFWDRRGVPSLARHYFETAFAQNEDNPGLCIEISDTYSSEGNYTAAEVWLFYAVEIAPSDPQVWEALARFYLNFGIDVEQSGLSTARRFLEYAPNDARAHDLMGWAQFLAGEYDHAQASLSRAITLDPNLPSAHFHMGRLQAHLGHHDEASQAYRRAAETDLDRQFTAQLERARMELPKAFQEGP